MERIRIAALFAACSLLVMSASAAAHAGERPLAIRPTGLTINMSTDGQDAVVGDGKCDIDPITPGNQCTLRAAIMEGNFWGPGPSINLKIPAGTYTLSIPPGSTDDASTGDLDLLTDFTFNGPALPNTAYVAGDVNFGDRLFDIPSGVAPTIYMWGLTLENGSAPNGESGGAIRSMGTGLLSINNTVFTTNTATGSGGGVYVKGGTLSLPSMVSFLDNHANVNGGGLDVEGATVATYVSGTVQGNTSGGKGAGAALFTETGGTGTFSVDTSTFSDNTATGSGGGVYAHGGTFTIPLNVTLDGNVSSANGGAVDVEGATLASLNAVTVQNGTAQNGGGISAFAEAGGTGSFTLTGTSTISANSATGNGGGLDLARATVTHFVYVQNNTAANGGGVQLRGSKQTNVLMGRVLIGGNVAAQNGGGVYATSCGKSCGLVQATTIGYHAPDGLPPDSVGNSAGQAGSGIYANGPLMVITSSIGENVTTGSGGGGGGAVYHAPGASAGALVLTEDTIVQNVGGLTPGGVVLASPTVDPITNVTIGANTGVVANGLRATGAAPRVKNTILADDAGDGVPVCAGAMTSLGHNLNSDNSCGLTSSGDLVSTDPGLSPQGLDDNGGGTNTWAPSNTRSPEVDAGDDKGCWATDQRFVNNPQDGNLDWTFHCDIGAYEFSASTRNSDLGMTVAASPNPVPKGSNLTFSINLSNAGPWSTLSTVVKVTLPNGVTYFSCSATGGIGGGTCSHSGQKVTISYPGGIDMPGSASATLVATVSPGISVTSISTPFIVSADNPDTFPNDNMVTVIVQVT